MTQVSSRNDTPRIKSSSADGVFALTGKKSDALSAQVDVLESKLAAVRGTNSSMTKPAESTDTAGTSNADTTSAALSVSNDRSGEEAAIEAELGDVKSQYAQAKDEEKAAAQAQPAQQAQQRVTAQQQTDNKTKTV